MADLPEELIADILLRVPVKSLLRFKPASKKWYTLISKDSEFARRHLKQSSSSNRVSLYRKNSSQAIAIFQSSEKTDPLEQRGTKRSITGLKIRLEEAYSLEIFKLPTEIPLSDIIGSANGLICVVPRDGRSCFFLWNPSTGECKKISCPALSKHNYSLSGFCYDSYSGDYKVAGIDCDLDLGIFSLKENSWRIYKYKSSYRFLLDYTAQFFNGAFHWCIHTKIIALNLATGKFFNMKMPEETKLRYRGYNFSTYVKVFEWLGSFCLFDHGSIWVMKQYGVAKSWIKLPTNHVKLPVGFPIAEIKDSFPHKESLISPNSNHLGK